METSTVALTVSFEKMRRQINLMAKHLGSYFGLSESLTHNIIQYAKCLARAPTPDYIDENIFFAQMSQRFGITSIVQVRNMFNALRPKDMNMIPMEGYIRLICTFLTKNVDHKINYVFSVHDQSKRKYIDRRQISTYLAPSLMGDQDDESDVEEAMKELTDIVLSVFDDDGEGIITLEEFRKHVKRNILYVQLFGQVLPNDVEVERFISLLSWKSTVEVRKMFENERKTSLKEVANESKSLLESLYPVTLDLP